MQTILASLIDNTMRDENAVVNSIRELVQEAILCGLGRGGFFNEAAFHGGTSLRIFHGLDRFSEDLDFCLLDPSKEFDLDKYRVYIEHELQALGLDMEVITKGADGPRPISGGKVKGNMRDIMRICGFDDETVHRMNPGTKLYIKFDIDTDTPPGFGIDHVYRTYPFCYPATLLDLPSLFAGKIGAVLTRQYHNRVKGRDLYDFQWYIENGVRLNVGYLRSNLLRGGFISESDPFDREVVVEMLRKRFETLDFESAIDDVSRFIKDDSALYNWTPEYFIGLSNRLLT